MAPADQATALSATSSSSIWRRSRFPQLDEAAVTCGEARRRQAAEDALVASTLDLVAALVSTGLWKVMQSSFPGITHPFHWDYTVGKRGSHFPFPFPIYFPFR